MRSGYLCYAYSSPVMNERFERAFKLLGKINIEDYTNGRYEIDEDMFILVQRYKSKPACEVQYEAHRKYVDIQYIVYGREAIYCADIKDMEAACVFDEQKDIGFYKNTDRYTKIMLDPGQYGLFMPEDCHKPSIHEEDEESCFVEKIVVKVKIN